jgi:YlmC/YmxH family sporulation protein
MAQKGMDFRHKEVISVRDGKRLGFVQDVCADLTTGNITSIIVPGTSSKFNIFSTDNDIVVPWSKIKCIGENVILVDI